MILMQCTIWSLFFLTDCEVAAQLKGQVAFILTNVQTLNPYHPIRFASWGEITNLPACAIKTFVEASYPIGFLYNGNENFCTPLIGYGETGGTTAMSGPVMDNEGLLYLFKRDCPVGFQLYETEDGEECLRPFRNDKMNYDTATSVCRSWGGYLVAAKTQTKLELIFSLINHPKYAWVGLDDLEEEGRLVWQSDGSAHSPEQLADLFTENNPDNHGGSEHCIQLQKQNEQVLLNDVGCWVQNSFVCEARHP